jgi:hypothetical protein
MQSPPAETKTITSSVPSPQGTPTRAAPRIAVQSDTRISGPNKQPISQCMLINVSQGGALLFTHEQQKDDALIQIELGPPIFPIPRLVRGRVAHIADAPEELLAVLRDKGKADKKKKGYLVGIEFTVMEKEARQTLARFINQRLREEQQRRAADRPDAPRPRSARDRVVRLDKARVPRWAYLLGLLTGAYELVAGLMNGDNDLVIAVRVGVALATFWFVGRIAAAVWNQLESWRVPEATIVARADGAAHTLDEVLADADSELDLPPTDNADAPRAPPETDEEAA